MRFTPTDMFGECLFHFVSSRDTQINRNKPHDAPLHSVLCARAHVRLRAPMRARNANPIPIVLGMKIEYRGIEHDTSR